MPDVHIYTDCGLRRVPAEWQLAVVLGKRLAVQALRTFPIFCRDATASGSLAIWKPIGSKLTGVNAQQIDSVQDS
jgi:hypothetical protein